jgi:protein SCO1/2
VRRVAVLLLLAGAVLGQAPPPDVGIDQKLDAQVPLDLHFVDDTGKEIELRDCFRGRPVVLALVYYRCPMLCTLVLNGLVTSLSKIPFDAGTSFDVVAVSIDPKETPDLASRKKATLLGAYGRPGAAKGFRFLTGKQDAIRALAKAVGFRYAYVPETGQFAHGAGIMVVTPNGKLSKYLYGVTYPDRDLRLALVEASGEKIGTLTDQVLLLCLHYDPSTGKYGFVIQGALRIGGILCVAALGLLVLRMLLKERRLRRAQGGGR